MLLAALLPLSLAATSAAQDGTVPLRGSEDLTASARFEQDRSFQQVLEEAANAIQRGETSQAIALLQTVLDTSRDELVLNHGVYLNAAAEANRMLAELSEADLRLYERHSGDAARAALQQVRASKNVEDLRLVAARYRHTAAGGDALRELAQQSLDTARFAEADVLYRELIMQAAAPDRSVRQHPADLLAWCAANIGRGDIESAQRIRNDFAAVLPENALSILSERFASAAENAVSPATAQVEEPIENLVPTSSGVKWTWDAGADEVTEVIDDGTQDLLAHGMPPFIHLQPIGIEKGIVVRVLDGVVCIDPATGTERWRKPLNSVGWFIPGNGLPHFLHAAGRSYMGNAALLRLTTDGKRVYCIQASEQPLPAAPMERFTVAERNTLVAIDAASGEIAWFVSGEPPPVDAEERRFAPPNLFRGPPTEIAGRLLVITEQAANIALDFLDPATGEILDRIPLCEIDQLLGRDDRRLVQAAPVFVRDGVAICPTGGGAVVGVDLTFRRVLWGFRYPREDERGNPGAAPVDPTLAARVVWATGWRDTSVDADGETAVLAGSETNRLYAFNMRTGDVRWSLPRGNGMYLAGVRTGTVLVVEERSIAAYQLADGSLIWRRRCSGRVVGRGYFADQQRKYVVPLSHGGVAAVEIDSGETFETRPATADEPVVEELDIPPESQPAAVNLVRFGDHIHSATLRGIASRAPLAAELSRSAAELQGSPESVTSAVSAASLLLERRDAAAALDLLRAHPPAHEAIDREAWRELAVESGIRLVAMEPDRLSEIEDWLKPLLQDEQEQIRLQWAAFASFVKPAGVTGAEVNVGDATRTALHNPDSLDGFIARAFQALDLPVEQYAVQLAADSRRVRLDRAIQGVLLRVRSGLDVEQRTHFDKLIDAAMAGRLSAGSELVRARYADLLDHMPQGAQLRLELEPRWSSNGEFARSQLQLRQVAALFPTETAAAALLRLARLYEAHSDPHEAAAVYRQLRERSPEVVAAEGTSVAELLAAIPPESAVGRILIGTVESPWPLTAPTVTARSGDDRLYFLPVCIDDERGGLFERLNVAVSRSGRSIPDSPAFKEAPVRFSGAELSRPWAAVLPDSQSDLRSAQTFPELRRGWAFGQFLVLQVGDEVFGIAPFNSAGEPSAALVWPEAGRTIRTTSTIAATVAEADDTDAAVRPVDNSLGPDRVDEFGHIIGSVGPVRAGYFCVQRDGRLIACDTATGVELWTRYGLSPGVRCFGDDRQVVVYDNAGERITVLSALDGAVLGSWSPKFALHQLVAVQDSVGLVETAEPDACRLEAINLSTGDSVWVRDFPAGSISFQVDPERRGILQPDGRVEFVRWLDGQTAGQITVEVPHPLVHLRCIHDSERLHLILSGPRNDPGLEAATPGGGIHSNEGFRRLIVNGPCYTLDRDSLELQWSTLIENASLPLDQPVDVPLLICNELRFPADRIGQGSLVGRVRVFDRRSGGLLYDAETPAVHNYYLIERNPDDGWLELRLPGQVVRFDFDAMAETAVPDR